MTLVYVNKLYNQYRNFWNICRLISLQSSHIDDPAKSFVRKGYGIWYSVREKGFQSIYRAELLQHGTVTESRFYRKNHNNDESLDRYVIFLWDFPHKIMSASDWMDKLNANKLFTARVFLLCVCEPFYVIFPRLTLSLVIWLGYFNALKSGPICCECPIKITLNFVTFFEVTPARRGEVRFHSSMHINFVCRWLVVV